MSRHSLGTAQFLIDRYGRRPVLFLYYFVGAFFHLWFAYAAGIWLCVAIGLVGWVNPGVYGSSGVYVSELYPGLDRVLCGLRLGCDFEGGLVWVAEGGWGPPLGVLRDGRGRHPRFSRVQNGEGEAGERG